MQNIKVTSIKYQDVFIINNIENADTIEEAINFVSNKTNFKYFSYKDCIYTRNGDPVFIQKRMTVNELEL